MKSHYSRLLLFVALATTSTVFAEGPGGLAAALRQFIDKHELAGAVTLVADRDKVLSIEAVGFKQWAVDRFGK